MIKIVAIKTIIAQKTCTSKTLVSIFQLVYIFAVAIVITQLDKTPQELFYTGSIVLFVLFLSRLTLKWFPKVCGECNERLENSQTRTCSECGSYNVYDLKLWAKLKFNDAQAAYKAETGRLIQNILALVIVFVIFSSPVAYFFLVIDKDIRELNQQRRFAFKKIRPAFLNYKTDHFRFPRYLEALVPDYLLEIPDVLITPKKTNHGILKINYQGDENTAKFTFYISYLPLSGIDYEVMSDQYNSDSKLTTLLW
ncbi:MAG: hypothetical protein Q9M50_03265 [Methylococcales bacterium]|nr:hypothetical protein [Methylococcales bacterium]